MIVAVFPLILVGTALICIAMRKHWRQLFPHVSLAPAQAAALRLAGAALLLAAAVLSTGAHGVGIGLTEFFGLLTIVIFGIAVLLPYAQRR
ncbi:MAG: DUF3325 family protein [Pseudomonadota bacterium]